MDNLVSATCSQHSLRLQTSQAILSLPLVLVTSELPKKNAGERRWSIRGDIDLAAEAV